MEKDKTNICLKTALLYCLDMYHMFLRCSGISKYYKRKQEFFKQVLSIFNTYIICN